MDPILDDLNAAQREAVLHDQGPMMVLAGAGSGKTRVITRRIARLIRSGVDPTSILALTFTNKAAGEMANRVQQLGGRRVHVSTFHSACARFLRHDAELIGFPTDFSIYDTYDRDACIKMIMHERGMKNDAKPSQVGRRISQLKNLGMGPDELIVGYSEIDRVVEKIFKVYQDTMHRLGAMDFDDLLGRFLGLLKDQPKVCEGYQERFRWLLVDEFQDTNCVQYDLLRCLVGRDQNICVVGDPDQSIYKFRGAEIRNILDFQDQYPSAKTIKLETNYRSTACILRAAESVISNNEQRLEKALVTENPEGEPLSFERFPGPKQEARAIAERIDALAKDGVSLDEIAVFYRSHFLSRSIEEGLREFAISYKVIGGVSFFERREIKDLLAYLRVLVNPIDDISMDRILNVPPRGIGKVTKEKLMKRGSAEGMSLFEVVNETSMHEGLSQKAKKSLRELGKAFEEAREFVGKSAYDCLRQVSESVGYLEHAGGMGDPEDLARLENIAELHNDATFFDSEIGGGLSAYLQHVSLMTSEDRAQEDQAQVCLMSIHAAKGLEFDHVFLTGLEEGLFPNSRAIEENDIEEERRLMYVAVTRARKTLWLGCCRERMVNGSFERQMTSSFLDEVPDSCIGEGADILARGGGMTAYHDVGEDMIDDCSDASDADLCDAETGGAEAGGNIDFDPWEMEVSQDEQVLESGVRVVHQVYGQGVVSRVAGQGLQAKATVVFDSGGERTLLLEYAGLQILQGGAEW